MGTDGEKGVDANCASLGNVGIRWYKLAWAPLPFPPLVLEAVGIVTIVDEGRGKYLWDE